MKSIRNSLLLILGVLGSISLINTGKFDQLSDDVQLVEKTTASNVYLKIYKNNEQIAFAHYDENSAQLFSLRVDDAFQNQGYGSFLFKQACTNLAKKGLDRMKWYASSEDPLNQPRLEKFYSQFNPTLEATGYKSMSIDLAPYREASS